MRALSQNSSPQRLLVAAVALGLTAAAAFAGTLGANAALPSTPSGWTQVFADDFTGSAGSGVNTANWQYTTGTSYPGGPANFGTGEVETMTSSTTNVRLDGSGNLLITPVRDGAGNWTSGRIETVRSDFQPPSNGVLRVEARIQLPNVTGNSALGYWPAFWMLGAPYRGNYWNWPSIGEIDIMENVNGINNEWATLHCGTTPGGPCNETSGIGGQRACSPTTCQADFHTYRVEWDRSTSPQQMRWYLDGVQFHTVNANQVDVTTWTNATNHGFYVILNVAMGGGFPAAFGGGPTSATVSGIPMKVDYVAVYSKAGSGSTSSPTPSATTGSGTRDAYSTIQAESYNSQSGTQLETCTDSGGGQNLSYVTNGDWALYQNVNFGSTPATQFYGRVASGAAGGVSGLVQIRLDSLSNAPIGSFALANTGGWQTWSTVPANITAVTGTHNVYLTFSSGQPADFVNVNWISFGH
ncbi:hypothetical protein HDA40_004206 [Hamadaea flava]|uniref:Glycoside hydrolase family 16 protein n=1 Tax=Hamadaea flava TaxID=1742688 RepID=A0ABV8LIL0_9ACTN|nr:glycoside hydrolase family 16 protein [Hamadaea flava]MCP2325699.1 hypothetical protein [Hamadaea flava]